MTDSQNKLDDARRALLQQRLKGKGVAARKPERIPRRPEGEPAPASFAQARLWFLAQLYPDNAAYHMVTCAALDGTVDPAALEQAFGDVVSRHEALRTHFEQSGPDVLQVVNDTVSVSLRVETLTDAADAHWREQAVAVAREAFDLEAGPLCRLCLFTLPDGSSRLLLVVHHIVSDEWSTDIILRELGACYSARVAGGEPQLDAATIGYADFAAWQKERIAGIEEKQLEFWRDQLAGTLPILDLPEDHPRPPRPSFEGSLRSITLPPALRSRLEALSRGSGTTLFTTLLAAFQVLLHRYTGQDDVLVGTPVANRGRKEIEQLVGLFLNTLVMRGRPAPERSFTDFLGDIRNTTVSALGNQELPLESLVRELAPSRDLSRNPLFQVMFVLETQADARHHFKGAECAIERLDVGVSKFDLTLFAGERGDALELTIEYAHDLFDQATIDAMLRALRCLLQSVVDDPAQPLSALQLLDDEDRAAVLDASTGTAVAYDAQASWLTRFRAQLQQSPDAPAVIDDAGHHSYAKLHDTAQRVAALLANSGVQRGERVGIYLSRGFNQVAAMVGAHYAGAAYVPLDPAYPAGRIASVVQALSELDGPPLVITARDHGNTEALAGARAVTIDTLPEPASASAAVEPQPDDLAYVIYTSGSTGTPKGVGITHANLMHSNEARIAYYGDPVGRYLLLSSFAFDSSVAGIFWALGTGGALVLTPPGTERDPRLIADAMQEHEVTHTLMLPTLYSMLLELGGTQKLASTRVVIVAGEACHPDVIERHNRINGTATLYNEYGPTEGTVWATVHRCETGDSEFVPIGLPIPNTRTYVLDAPGQLVPAGVTGELCIAGNGVAAGYLGTTADNSPFDDDTHVENGGRLYRTGDLVRQRRGKLQYLGRIDEQIKIRGYRVEPGEIEAELTASDAVADAAVVVFTGHDGNDRLAAYVTPTGEGSADLGLLRTALGERLPDYMVPAAITVLDELPRTPAGKIDRNALPEPQLGTESDGEPDDADDDDVLREVRSVWKSLLGTQPRLHDDFFDLGGHSLLGVSLMLEIETRLGITLPLATLFEASRLDEFAGRVRGAGSSDEYSYLIKIRPTGSKPPVFCVHGGARLLARHLPDDIPVYLLFQDTDEGTAEQDSVEDIAARYLAELRTVQPHGPYRFVGFSFGGMIMYEMAQQLMADGEEIAMFAMCDPPPLIGRSLFGLRARRKWMAFASQPGIRGKLRYLINEPLGIAMRRIDGLGMRLMGTWYEKTMRSWLFAPWFRHSLLALGLGLMVTNGVLMNAPDWQPISTPLELRTGESVQGEYTAGNGGTHIVELTFLKTGDQSALKDTALARRDPSTLDIDWTVEQQTAGGWQTIGRGDSRDYLFVRTAQHSLPGRVRRAVMQVPYEQDTLSRNTVGILGKRIASRGVGSFQAQEGERYRVSATIGDDYPALDHTQPRLVVGPDLRSFDDHYKDVVPFGIAGLSTLAVWAILSLFATLRRRQAMPANLIAFRNLQHHARVSKRYDYKPFMSDADLFLPDDKARIVESTIEAWKRVIKGELNVHVIKGASKHLDLIHEAHGRQIAGRVAEILGTGLRDSGSGDSG
ncbi:MAG: amino acid adenylation domain-containing protein [Pseudomonadota bacterium]